MPADAWATISEGRPQFLKDSPTSRVSGECWEELFWVGQRPNKIIHTHLAHSISIMYKYNYKMVLGTQSLISTLAMIILNPKLTWVLEF